MSIEELSKQAAEKAAQAIYRHQFPRSRMPEGWFDPQVASIITEVLKAGGEGDYLRGRKDACDENGPAWQAKVDEAWNEAIRIAETTWVLTTVGFVRIEHQAEYERDAIVAALKAAKAIAVSDTKHDPDHQGK